VKGITSIDSDARISFPPEIKDNEEEPRFLEQIQLFVDSAAAKTDIQADMLKYIMACDNVLRF
jgi:hypothetical protein